MSERAPLGLLALAALALVGSLHTAPLFDLDETIYALAAREMLTTGHWFAPSVHGEPFLEKPPLGYWPWMLSFALFGVNAFAARLPSVLATLLTAWLLAHTLRALLGRRTALVAALLYLSFLQVQVLARAAIFDPFLNLCITGALLLYARFLALARAQDLAWAGFFAGLGVAVKGPVGLVIPLGVIFAERVLAAGFAALVGIVPQLVRPRVLAAFLLAALPPYLGVYLSEGTAFFADFFLRHNLERAASAMQGHAGGWHYYLVVIALGGLPLSPALLPALAAAWRRRSGTDHEALVLRLAFAWFIFVPLLFSFVATKLPHYVSSIWPAGAILLALGWPKRPGWARAGAALAGLLGAFFVLLVPFWPELEHLVHHPRARAALADAAPPDAALIVWGLFVLGMAVWAALRPQPMRLATLGLALGLAVAAGAAPVVAQVQEGPLLAIARDLRTLPADVPVFSLALEAPSVAVYGRDYHVLADARALAKLHPPFALFLRSERRQDLPAWLRARTPRIAQGGYLYYRVER